MVSGDLVVVPTAGVVVGANVEADVEELLLRVLGENVVAKLNDDADPDPKVDVPKLNDVDEPNGLAAGGLKVEAEVDAGAAEVLAVAAGVVVEGAKGLGPTGLKENWAAEANGLVPKVDGAAVFVVAAGFTVDVATAGGVAVKGVAEIGAVGVVGVVLNTGGVEGVGPKEREDDDPRERAVDEPKEREVEEPKLNDEEEPEGLKENAGAVAAEAGVGAGLCLGGSFAMPRPGNFTTGGWGWTGPRVARFDVCAASPYRAISFS